MNKGLNVIYHSRKKFYNGKDIYWYEFLFDDGENMMADTISIGKYRFLRVPETKYYEYGGEDHKEAIEKLTLSKAFSIKEGDEL